jgi:hypothetical protein
MGDAVRDGVNKQGHPSYEFFMSKNIYEPLFGVQEKAELMTRDHCLYREDLMLGYIAQFPFWEVIGTFDQVYGD